MSGAAPWASATAAQARMELRLTARRGENLLAIVVIPVAILVILSTTDFMSVAADTTVATLLPGMLAIAVIATGLVNLGIATAYERSYGVLKRLGGSPLGRSGLVAAKVAAVAVIVVGQAVVLLAVAVALGFSPAPGWSPVVVVTGLAAGTATFAALGLLLAGTLRAEATLAIANGVFLAALLLSGAIVPVAALPDALAAVAGILPSAALADWLRGGFGATADLGRAVVVLVAWGMAAVVLAVRTFRWD